MNSEKKKEVEVFEEVTAIAEEGSIRRSDIIVLQRKESKGYIIDPTVRYEINASQPEDVNKEKKQIYNKTIKFYQEKYQIQNFEVIGLFIGSRGTISRFFVDFWNTFKLNNRTIYTISSLALKHSVHILRNHLYNHSNNML